MAPRSSPPPGRWSRRDLLRAGASLGAGALLGLPRPGRAVEGSDLRFVFVFARGGWDTTRVFSPMGHAPLVETEPEAVTVHDGGLSWVDHPDRPNVLDFFTHYGRRAAVIDGLLVRSVNHAICERLVQTGSARADRPDWASILGSVAAADHALPALVLDGPTNPGPLHRTTSIVGTSGQLKGLLDRSAFSRGDQLVAPPTPELEDRIDALVASAARDRRDREADPGWWRVYDAQVDAQARLDRLRVDASQVSLAASSFNEQAETAVALLAANVARCVSISLTTFDSHGDTASQSTMFERLFAGLLRLMHRLDTTPGRRAPTLAEETIVVVQSEMGRTPYLNRSLGKDHWPYTAAMLLGPGVRGGLRVGGYDDQLSGLPMDLTSGKPDPAGTVVTSEHLGATLLTLADLDARQWVEADVLGAVMA